MLQRASDSRPFTTRDLSMPFCADTGTTPRRGRPLGATPAGWSQTKTSQLMPGSRCQTKMAWKSASRRR